MAQPDADDSHKLGLWRPFVLMAELLALLLWCVAWPASASSEPVSRPQVVWLTASQTHLTFEGHPAGTLLRWVDETGRASWKEAQAAAAAGHFMPATCPRCSGFTSAAHWYVLRVKRAQDAPSRWLLAIGAPYLNDVQVWQQGPDGVLNHVQMGDRFMHEGRPMDTYSHAMPVDLPPGAETILWIRIQSTSALKVSLDLWQPEAFWQQEMRMSWTWGLVFGLLGLTILTNLVFGLWLRDAVMAYYGAFIAALLVMWSGVSGIALVLYPGAPWWFSDLVTGGGTLLSMGVGNLFTVKALEMTQRYPRAAWMLKVPALIAFCAVPIAVTDGYRELKSVFDLSVFVTECLSLWVALALWRSTRKRLHLVYLIGAACYAAGAWVAMVTLMGGGSGQGWLGQVFVVTNVLYLFIMLAAMGMRVSSLRTDKLFAVERAADQRRFVAMLTHEFRNPLASIDRSANLLQRIPDLSREQIGSRLAAIRQQAHRLNTLVDSFLLSDSGGVSRLQRLQLEPCDVAVFLMDMRQALDEYSRARLEIKVQPDGLYAVFDPALLRLALHNLIDNALRYSPQDQPVVLHVTQDKLAGEWVLSVRDHGPGLPPHELAHLGTPHFRGSTSAGKQGSGLGYHFCCDIVQAHGGRIEARAAAPHGLIVRLCFRN